MRKAIILLLCSALLVLCSCTAAAPANTDSVPPENEPQAADSGGDTPQLSDFDVQGCEASLSDWVISNGFGVESGKLDAENGRVILTISGDTLTELTEIDEYDILDAMNNLLIHYGADPAYFTVLYDIDGDLLAQSVDAIPPDAQPAQDDAPSDDTPSDDTPSGDTPSNQYEPDAPPKAEGDTVNLIFIHHSCGENWLNDGLNTALNDSGFHVADTYYGWREYGDNTDTTDWPTWFTDSVMQLVYTETGTMTANNSIPPAAGENEIVMFKSCYPNSDVGNDIADEQAIYNSLLPYFESHPDKMFILVTPPPMMHIGTPQLTRDLTNWLVDRSGGWLSGLSTGNVFVFDFYNVLTHPNAHHMAYGGDILHVVSEGADTLYYDSGGDDHPNGEGNQKAAREFMSLLGVWREMFAAR